uniref:Uncharacterized protein n=1 Tax=Steinernema glaseri TaxID=37863 RepID=A0A1I7YMB3_9BILA
MNYRGRREIISSHVTMVDHKCGCDELLKRRDFYIRQLGCVSLRRSSGQDLQQFIRSNRFSEMPKRP